MATFMTSVIACHACLENKDLINYIIEYCAFFDLLNLEIVCQIFQGVVQNHYRDWLLKGHFHYLAYKRNRKYSSIKERICRIVHNRTNYGGQFYLFGGNFGSLRTATLCIEDNPHEFNAKIVHELPNRGAFGSASYAIDSNNLIFRVGGWSDLEEETSDSVDFLDLNMPKSKRIWKSYNTINSARCFSSMTSTLTGDLLVTGGGDSPFRGATVFDSCLFKHLDETGWKENFIASMHIPRCGHESVTFYNNNVLVAGGYSGAVDYHETAELYDWEKNLWYKLPSMHHKRSGFASVIGPHGSLYVCGGSYDGSFGNKSLERFDPREGKWTLLAEMQLPRGYTSGAVGGTGILYVCGGLNEGGIFQGGMECYDFRSDQWFALSGSNMQTSNTTNNNFTPLPPSSNWSRELFPAKKPSFLNKEVMSYQLLRASHKLFYVEF